MLICTREDAGKGDQHGCTLWRTIGGDVGRVAGGCGSAGGDSGAVGGFRRAVHAIDPAGEAAAAGGGVHQRADVGCGAEERRVDRLSSRPGTQGDAVFPGGVEVGSSTAARRTGHAGGPGAGARRRRDCVRPVGLSQEGDGVGRRAAAMVRPAGQDRELPGGGVHGLRVGRGARPGQYAAVSAAGVGPGQSPPSEVPWT